MGLVFLDNRFLLLKNVHGDKKIVFKPLGAGNRRVISQT